MATTIHEDSRFTGTLNGYGFGNEIVYSFDGSLLAVGANFHAYPDAPGTDQGAVYLYDDSGSGEPVSILQPTRIQGDLFGNSVSMSYDGSILVVGAPGDDFDRNPDPDVFDNDYVNGSGSVYIYDLSSGSPVLVDEIEDAQSIETLDQFGWNTALSGDGSRMAVSSNVQGDGSGGASLHGDMLVYDLDGGGNATFLYTVTPDAPPPAGQLRPTGFGRDATFSADGDLLVVSAPQEITSDGAGSFGRGTVYVFDVSSGAAPVQVARIAPTDTGGFGDFGGSLSLSADGSVLVVAADQVNGFGVDAGSGGFVYVYDLDASGQPSLRYRFTADDNDPIDQFGSSVSLSADGATLYVGAAGWDGPDLDTETGEDVNEGVIYAYDISGDSPVLMAQFTQADGQRIPGFAEDIGAAPDGSAVAGSESLPPPTFDQFVSTFSEEFLSWERSVGTAGGDRLVGGALEDAIFGSDGGDRIFGGNGRGWLDGGDGNDVVVGGTDSDVLIDGAGRDLMRGGSGQDLYAMAADAALDGILGFDAASDQIDVSAWGLTAPWQLSFSEAPRGIQVVRFEDETLLLTGDQATVDDFIF